VTDGIPPPSRNHRTPTTGDTPTSTPAASLPSPRAIAAQNRCRCSRRPTGGRPGERITGRPVKSDAHPFGLPIATLPDRALRRPIEFAQYTAVLFTKRCAKAGIEISMGSTGDCYDNAVCETFHATLKKERIYRQSWPTRSQARAAVFEYIEGWYNPRRRHSTLGYLSPIEFERQHTELAQLALEAPNTDNGSVASITPRASDGLTTRRVSTVGIEFAADSPITPEIALAVPTESRSGRDRGSREKNGNGWPRRPVVKEQAR
jgi:Integrase core domain